MLVPVLLMIQFIFVQPFRYQKPIAEKIWSVHCKQNDHVLNDCNWCWCAQNHRFQCKARVCEEVDMFGHFKDTIQEMDVGMEGHGTWRSRPNSCTPGVQYQRGTVLCVCDDDGNWPNPVCRDLFRILHAVEVTNKVDEATSQTCSPTKFYLVGCNTCFCPTSGKFNANFCTNRTCSDGDPVLERINDKRPVKFQKEGNNVKDELRDNQSEHNDDEELSDDKGELKGGEKIIDDDVQVNDMAETAVRTEKELEVYASCNRQVMYTVGDQKCECLSNNRLICKENDKLISRETKVGPNRQSRKSVCSGNIGKVIKNGCNVCLCVEKSYMHCTSRKCIGKHKRLSAVKMPKLKKEVKAPVDDLECIPGTFYKRGCNKCFCDTQKSQKIFGCTVKSCYSEDEMFSMSRDCVSDTTYVKDCLICFCNIMDGEKYEICGISPRYSKMLNKNRMEDLETLHGSCEPRHVYRNGCNTCTCMSNGKIVRCTTRTCVAKTEEPVEVEILPIQQAMRQACPKGHSYKIECNMCFCLSNGNAICTTADCSKQDY